MAIILEIQKKGCLSMPESLEPACQAWFPDTMDGVIRQLANNVLRLWYRSRQGEQQA